VPKKTSKKAINKAKYFEITTQIQQASSFDNLITTFGNDLGIHAASYHPILDIGDPSLGDNKRFFTHNFPKEIIEFFDTEHDLQADPGVIRVFSTGHFVWLSEMLEDKLILEKDDGKRIHLVMSVIGDCLLMPLYGPQNRRGYGTISFGKDKIDFNPAFPWQIQNLAQMAHVRYCLMLDKLRKKVRLTNREIEVLELITFGKTNPEIGLILDISPNTVSGYVKQIFLKLDTSDRVTTALRARSLNLIS